jgi:hypothetical protein
LGLYRDRSTALELDRDLRECPGSAELLRSVIDGDSFWSEWRWTGSQPDGRPMTIVGTIIMGIENGLISWGRIYMESEVQMDTGSAEFVA